MNSQVNIGAVRTSDHVEPNKEQALKPLEEAVEALAKSFEAVRDAMRNDENRQHIKQERRAMFKNNRKPRGW